MMRTAGWLVALLLVVCSTALAQNERVFSHPDRIRYDGQCLTIDGKDTFIYSGCFHYFRCPKELWDARLATIKSAGFNAIETYVPWNVHEVEMPAGLDDFSKVDLSDLDHFLTLAEQHGLYVIIRPGPYICAEWDRGGFPGWLITKKPQHPKTEPWFRGDDPTFVAWSKHWYDAVCPVIAKHQITRKAPGEKGVILFQLENEYDYAPFSDEIKANYLKDLAEDAQAKGIDVPLFTCWARPVRGSTDPILRQVYDSCNFYPRWNVDEIIPRIEDLRKSQPDAPLQTTELQGGWFTNVSGTPPLRPDRYNWDDGTGPSQIQNLTLLTWQLGETITNYYMLFGGTNLADHAANGIATSYDYSAPIRENGGIDEKYLRVQSLGQMIAEHGAELARAKAVDLDVKVDQPDVTVAERRAPDGGRYIFIRTDQHESARQGTARVSEKGGSTFEFNYDLEPFGSKVLYLPPGVSDAGQGQWLPRTLAPIARPGDLPSAITISNVLTRADAGPNQYKPLPAGQSLNDLGIYDSRFVYYQFNVHVDPSEQAGHPKPMLRVGHSLGDEILATLDGKTVFPRDDFGTEALLDPMNALRSGDSQATLLFENRGTGNFGPGMEKRAGVLAVGLVDDDRAKEVIGNWRMKLIDSARRPQRLAEVAEQFDDQSWSPVAVDKIEADQLHERQNAVFRTTVDVSQESISKKQTALNIGRMDDRGWVFVNGKLIGRGEDWEANYTFEAGPELHAGKNTIAVVIQNNTGPGGLGTVRWASPNAGQWHRFDDISWSDQNEGVRGQWWKPSLDTASWEKQALPQAKKDSDALLTWDRLDFELPSASAHVWVPWLLRLHAQGDGFIYLNGHFLGRYWELSGQRDFFLPDCWLNFGQANDVTLCLAPARQGIGVESAQVIPYTAYAENR